MHVCVITQPAFGRVVHQSRARDGSCMHTCKQRMCGAASLFAVRLGVVVGVVCCKLPMHICWQAGPSAQLSWLHVLERLCRAWLRGCRAGKASVAPAFADLLAALTGGSLGSVHTPSTFLKRMGRVDSRWSEGSQQDSQEFMHALLDTLQV